MWVMVFEHGEGDVMPRSGSVQGGAKEDVMQARVAQLTKNQFYQHQCTQGVALMS